MAPVAFAQRVVCMEYASCVVHIVCLPTMHDIDIATCRFSQNIRLGSHTDYPCMVFAFDCMSTPYTLVDNDTAQFTLQTYTNIQMIVLIFGKQRGEHQKDHLVCKKI